MKQLWDGPLNKIDDYRWEIPKTYNSGMRVPGLIYASSNLLEKIRRTRHRNRWLMSHFYRGLSAIR